MSENIGSEKLLLTGYVSTAFKTIKDDEDPELYNMNVNFLEFEQPIAELQAKIEELRLVGDDHEVNIGEEIARLEEKSKTSPGFALTQKASFSPVSTFQ